MKRIVSIIVASIILLASFSAGAQMEFKLDPMYNYTADCTFKMTFDSSREVVALLKELQLPDEFENYVDIESLFKSLLSIESKMFMQADISKDMKKAQIAITADGFQTIDVNKNLDVSIAAKMGMWLIYDFTDVKKPVYEVVYSYPVANKYMIIDLIDIMPEEERQTFIDTISKFLNPEYTQEINSFVLGLINKHAKVTASLSKVTVKIDNKSLIAILNDITPYLFAQMEQSLAASAPKEELEQIGKELAEFSFDGWQLLGDKGIEVTYNLRNGVISSEEANADISIDISKIYTAITGEAWQFVSNGKLEFSISSYTTVSNAGNTKVEFPTITEDNSFSLSDIIKEGMGEYHPDDGEEDSFSAYPYWYVGAEAANLPVINGDIYVPFRATLEEGYADTVRLSFDNGVITASCEYFPGFKTITLTNGSDKIYCDGVEKTTGTVIIENGTTYVSSKLFTDVFGWSFDTANYDMLNNIYWYGFYTVQE